MPTELATILCMFSFIAAFWLGVYIEGQRWRKNADVIFRLESKGKLYKVTRSR